MIVWLHTAFEVARACDATHVALAWRRGLVTQLRRGSHNSTLNRENPALFCDLFQSYTNSHPSSPN